MDCTLRRDCVTHPSGCLLLVSKFSTINFETSGPLRIFFFLRERRRFCFFFMYYVSYSSPFFLSQKSPTVSDFLAFSCRVLDPSPRSCQRPLHPQCSFRLTSSCFSFKLQFLKARVFFARPRPASSVFINAPRLSASCRFYPALHIIFPLRGPFASPSFRLGFTWSY